MTTAIALMPTRIATRSAAAQTAIEGVTYLLGATPQGDEWVSRYGPSEMTELFNACERRLLAIGETIIARGLRWTDMVAAARAAAIAG